MTKHKIVNIILVLGLFLVMRYHAYASSLLGAGRLADVTAFRNGWILAAAVAVASLVGAVYNLRGVKLGTAQRIEVVLSVIIAAASIWFGIVIFKMWQLSLTAAG